MIIDIIIPIFTNGSEIRYKLTEKIFKHFKRTQELLKLENIIMTFTILGSEKELSKDLTLKYFNESEYFEFDQSIYNCSNLLYNKNTPLHYLLTDKFREGFKQSFLKNPNISLLCGSNDYVCVDFFRQVSSFYIRKPNDKEMYGIDNYYNGKNIHMFTIFDDNTLGIGDKNSFYWDGIQQAPREKFKYCAGIIGFNDNLYNNHKQELLTDIIEADEGIIEEKGLSLPGVKKFTSIECFYFNIKTSDNSDITSFDILKQYLSGKLKYLDFNKKMQDNISTEIKEFNKKTQDNISTEIREFNKKIKFAFIVSFELRAVKKTIDNLYKYIIDYYDADVFIICQKTFNDDVERVNLFNRNVKLVHLYDKPDPVNYFGAHSNITNPEKIAAFPWNNPSNSQICINFTEIAKVMKNYVNTYDYFIHFRVDSQFLFDLPPPKLFEEIPRTNYKFVPKYSSEWGAQGMFNYIYKDDFIKYYNSYYNVIMNKNDCIPKKANQERMFNYCTRNINSIDINNLNYYYTAEQPGGYTTSGLKPHFHYKYKHIIVKYDSQFDEAEQNNKLWNNKHIWKYLNGSVQLNKV